MWHLERAQVLADVFPQDTMWYCGCPWRSLLQGQQEQLFTVTWALITASSCLDRLSHLPLHELSCLRTGRREGRSSSPGVAASCPGETNRYSHRAKGHEVVWTLGAQARPVTVDGNISGGFAGSWCRCTDVKKTFPLWFLHPLSLTLLQDTPGLQLSKRFVTGVCFIGKT